jgi:hypothetical protein
MGQQGRRRRGLRQEGLGLRPNESQSLSNAKNFPGNQGIAGGHWCNHIQMATSASGDAKPNWWGALKNRYAECRPVDPPKEHVVTGICKVSGWISLATLLPLDRKSEGKRSGGLEGYVVLWLIALVLMLFGGPSSGCWAVTWAWVGLYRLQDLVFASLDNVFGLTERGMRWQKRSDGGVGPVVIALWNIVQVIVIFALAYQNLAGHGDGVFEGPKADSTGPSGHFGFLYLSWTTLFPATSGYTAISPTARWLVMVEGASGLLIIGLTLAGLLSRLKDEKTSGGSTASTAPSTEIPNADPAKPIRNFWIISFFSVSTGVVAGFTVGVLFGMLTFG